jgi:hypothetical protein
MSYARHPDLFGGAADAQRVGRARANHVMSGQRMIQPRDCCGPTANACESGIRARSRETHALPGQASTGNARERHPKGTHPAAIVVGTESLRTRSDAVACAACDRHRVQPRAGGTHPNAIPGAACGRHPIRQVVTSLRRGAAQPAHAARRRSGDEIVPILERRCSTHVIPIYTWRRG